SGLTERFHAESSNGTNDAASESADVAQATAGATGAKASTGNTATISQLIALALQSTSCPPDTVKAPGTSCTDDGNVCTADVCNVAESCAGTSATCPTDTLKANGTVCTDDGNVCTTDTCNGSSAVCQHPAGNAGTVCRATVNECDLAESCTGTSTTCPTNVVKAAGTACTDDGNVCTTDTCNGT